MADFAGVQRTLRAHRERILRLYDLALSYTDQADDLALESLAGHERRGTMERIAKVMVVSLALLALGKLCPLGTHWRHVVADQSGDSGDDSGDTGDDSGDE